MPRKFFDRGARAFLGTEIRVPIVFASRFATAFFHFLFGDGREPISAGEALAQAKRFFWVKYRNVGGLFYSLINDYDAVMTEEGDVRLVDA